MSAISKPILRIKLVIILFKLLLCLYQRTPLMIYNYLSQCWPRAMSPCGVTIPQAVKFHPHYSHVIMSAMASQITAVTIVYSIVCWGADKKKHQSSASLAFVRGIHRWPVNSPHKGPVTRKMFPFDDVIMKLTFFWWSELGCIPKRLFLTFFFLNLVGFNQLFVIPHDLLLMCCKVTVLERIYSGYEYNRQYLAIMKHSQAWVMYQGHLIHLDNSPYAFKCVHICIYLIYVSYFISRKTSESWGRVEIRYAVFKLGVLSNMISQSLETDMQRLFYSTWQLSFSSHIKKGE